MKKEITSITLDSLIQSVAISLNIGIVFCITNKTGCIPLSTNGCGSPLSCVSSSVFVFNDENSVEI